MLGPTLLSIHNLTFYQRLMARAREAIERGEYSAFLAEQRKRLGDSPEELQQADEAPLSRKHLKSRT